MTGFAMLLALVAVQAERVAPAKMIVLGSDGGVAVTPFSSVPACKRAEASLTAESSRRAREQEAAAARNGGSVAKYRPAPVTYCVADQ